MIVNIASLEDPRLDVYARLTEAQLRNKLEPEKGIFIAESGKVIERALEGGMEPLSLLMEAKWLPSMQHVLTDVEARFPGTPVFVAPHEQLERLVGFELTRGALAAFHRPPLPSVAEVCAGAKRVAVLENITNHTNVGAIFRSAAALGMDAVLVTPSCYDPLYRRAVRVSMGTVFQIPWTYIGLEGDETDVKTSAAAPQANADVKTSAAAPQANANALPKLTNWAETGIPQLRELGFTTVALALSDDSLSLDDPQLAQCDKLALVFGTEGDGLAHSTISRCDYTVKIPMFHNVDSLNVAAASAVAFWELRAPKNR
ncbi:MAG: RNA methyltransferase [Eggerthellaceae bacterium]|nr:RNA methyltransferase [Eggerthellaceae bacterium]